MSKTNRRRMRKKKHKHNLRVTLYLTRQHPWTLFGNSVTQLPKQPKKKKETPIFQYTTVVLRTTCIVVVTTEYKNSYYSKKEKKYNSKKRIGNSIQNRSSVLRALRTMSSRVDLWLSETPAPLKGLSVLARLPHLVLALLTTVQTGRCRMLYGNNWLWDIRIGWGYWLVLTPKRRIR